LDALEVGERIVAIGDGPENLQGIAFFNPSNQAAQFPAGLSRWLGHVKGFAYLEPFMSVPEYPLGLEAEAIASVIRIVHENRHNDLGVIVGIDSLLTHKNVGIPRVAR
jgi:hypothetical protein